MSLYSLCPHVSVLAMSFFLDLLAMTTLCFEMARTLLVFQSCQVQQTFRIITLVFSLVGFELLAHHLELINLLLSFSIAQMELDRSADPPPAIWVSTTKSSVNKWVSMCATSQTTGQLFLQQLWTTMLFSCNPPANSVK